MGVKETIEHTLDALEKYWRLEVQGTEHIPKNGHFICIADRFGAGAARTKISSLRKGGFCR